ncbi:uncharacterized protein BBA_00200 [Beauveria bassiana ARSEF 2860]|uniref:Uncharacterized protein n=1 Tax=Beauveria bassiana (strain ARSEF 2860) TaxID=655819 RepID=J4WLF4_BEAB2|nr:uncharacterized protein BBA_00200 [Beauveria bassiana ARSEF 2860]EJP70570.1 hypothetical protein BBA_00200 [Beauveria bassiana ARSEF 2860]
MNFPLTIALLVQTISVLASPLPVDVDTNLVDGVDILACSNCWGPPPPYHAAKENIFGKL